MSSAEAQARWRASHPEHWARVHAAAQRRRLDRHQRAMRALLATGCVDCGGSGVLFHHVDPPTKLFDIAHGWQVSKARLAVELRKCVVLCKQCHANRHKALA